MPNGRRAVALDCIEGAARGCTGGPCVGEERLPAHSGVSSGGSQGALKRRRSSPSSGGALRRAAQRLLSRLLGGLRSAPVDPWLVCYHPSGRLGASIRGAGSPNGVEGGAPTGQALQGVRRALCPLRWPGGCCGYLVSNRLVCRGRVLPHEQRHGVGRGERERLRRAPAARAGAGAA